MIIGTLIMSIHIPASESLKGKRAVLRSPLTRTRNSFNVSIAEVDHLDKWQRATIGVACVNTDQKHANATLDKVVELWNRESDLQILDYDISLETIGLEWS
ncbi:MAG: DUF503 domain-containing protein [Candidatus Wallbacteria bacterium HGW-Wallbacteria-1]|uniref:DUF503 domain-containing protein n=1 Tax=Candidatus Wallbacteria bacterium HGW-Wallbacteria-1 TaxID=2013854 RepID=A0A2N1PP74_9BACT|nr:MAG: DUF503 domain-containing protein [Candidatus Wallbacteria bacterium HGW-Wallbacteria-1]